MTTTPRAEPEKRKLQKRKGHRAAMLTSAAAAVSSPKERGTTESSRHRAVGYIWQ